MALNGNHSLAHCNRLKKDVDLANQQLSKQKHNVCAMNKIKYLIIIVNDVNKFWKWQKNLKRK